MTWGQQNTQQEAFQQLDYALAQGVNFIDTAEMYPIPPTPAKQFQTEEIIGHWLQKRQTREQIILATKVLGPAPWMPWVRNGKTHPNRKQILQAIDGSLKRLKTDYIDLYQIHWPDRTTNFFGQLNYEHQADETPIQITETLECLNELVQQGKVRYIGISNETPWGMMQYIKLSEINQLQRIQSIQNPYNLLNRSFEIGLSEISLREQIGLLAYSPLGFGVLSGKYLAAKKPKQARLSCFPNYQRYSNKQAQQATKAYVELAKTYHIDPAQMALAYVNSRPFVTSTIIGATTLDQLRANIASINLSLPSEVLQKIEAIHQKTPNPAP
ncbi:protein tas-like [Ylistrum balloti]|uniref:protein tas-like n=1 Tax=Ylistrum balloti TaxID=509963 RepID=UPI002905E5CC|nr:protein tas-like [Ylistrum balloti]